MIKFKEAFEEEWQVVTPTIFPDGTSQVWKLKFNNRDPNKTAFSIQWNFESEAEFIHLAQLVTLLSQHGYVHNLYIPYFPYARQDKAISNSLTFSRNVFLNLLDNLNIE